nr:hypothetical protein [Streptomyces sp. DSM 41633]
LAFALAEDDEPADTEQDRFRDRITGASPGDELTALWHRTLTGWDLAEEADWSTAPPRTDERRADAYDLLGFDPGLRKVLNDNLSAGRLRFTTDYDEAADFADVHFLGVGTPQKKGEYSADLRHVHAVIDTLVPR